MIIWLHFDFLLQVFLLLLQILLGKFVAKEKLDEKFADEFVDKCTQVILCGSVENKLLY